jgi:hypothetical protein
MEELNITSLQMGDFIENKLTHTPYLVGEDYNNNKILINLNTGRFIHCNEESVVIDNFQKMSYNLILKTKSN